jgi:adenylate cyclase
MKWLTSIWTTLAVLGMAIGLKVANPEWVQQIRLMGYDQKILSIEEQHSEDVVLLDIGEATLAVEGQFPFSRDRYARIISDIINANGGVTSFTILFPEADRFGQDAVFASWASEPSAIVLAAKSSNQGLTEESRRPNIVVSGNGDPKRFIDEYPGIVTNIPALESVVRGIGMVNPSLEVDGLTRRIPLVVQANDKLYPSLPLESIRAINNTKGYTIKVDKDTGIDSMYIHPREFKTNPDGSVWINWNVKMDRYEWMKDSLPDLQGKTVIVGVTAEGVENPIPTPAGLQYAHQVQGAVLATLLTQNYGSSSAMMIARPMWADLFEWGSLILLSLMMIVAIYRWPLIVSGCATIVSLISGWFVSAFVFSDSMYLLDWTFTTIVFIILALHAYGNNFIVQFMLRQQIKKQFETYLDPKQVYLLQKNPELLRLGGDRKEMSFLFMDICGFTPISEHYKNNNDPEGLVELVNEFLDAMTKIILNNGGTIDKYMGDCIMAFWNAPLPCDNHAEMAVKSSIEIEAKTNELKEVYKSRGLPDINVGTGVNTGDCIVGNMGSESRFDYSVIGDAVNLAARLEATAARHEYVDYKTIISSYTQEQLPDEYKCEEIGKIKVKGKEELITIYSPRL